ncbi:MULTISPECIES: c-type cytochrome [Psychrobacter]|uniref:c-type cytochrome n=1 Tax=Psychrobacter TaxID=497 RepID=UPI001919470B|nr:MULTISPECIES: c-type cytochrome [Psychrobacter]
MRSIISVAARAGRALGGSVATLILCTAMMGNAVAADISTIYSNSCAACHDSGALNAVKKGDSTRWHQLIEQKGLPTLINSVKGGMIQMPAGGLCDECDDDDYRKLIDYMSQ